MPVDALADQARVLRISTFPIWSIWSTTCSQVDRLQRRVRSVTRPIRVAKCKAEKVQHLLRFSVLTTATGHNPNAFPLCRQASLPDGSNQLI